VDEQHHRAAEAAKVSDEGLDTSVLRRLGNLKPGTFEGLIAIFVRTAPAMLEDITAAFVADDAARLVNATHRLRGIAPIWVPAGYRNAVNS
jgi:HPt (histidine-containing phosphotransfer) domain-containing protein